MDTQKATRLAGTSRRNRSRRRSHQPASPLRVGFAIGTFDPTQPLYVEVLFPVDPSTAPAEAGATDSAGNTYATSHQLSDRVCTTNPGSGQNLCPDVAVSALRPNSEPVFLTILSGDFDEFPYSPVFFDRDGNIVITGRTGSDNFQITAGAHQSTNAGPTGAFPRLFQLGGDLFVSVLNGRTGDLLYSTFPGGAEAESINRFATAKDSALALQISTGSSFPVTPGAWLASGTKCDRRL